MLLVIADQTCPQWIVALQDVEEGRSVLPLVTYELVRQMEEERRDRSLRRFRWRFARTEAEMMPVGVDGVADVIELAFGTRCEMEEPIGA